MKRILKKILMMLLCCVILLNMFANSIFAAIRVNMNQALIETIGTADNHLKYYREKLGKYTYHATILMGYKGEDGTVYPVYCVNKELPGADEGSYYIKTDNILENDKIWRIIKNGYPFKTAQEWGLTDDKNLYAITRFAIYCILGQEKLEYFLAEEDDSEAIAMLKALKQLVDIGENGIEKQDDNPLSIEKVGNFIEKGDYYLQEYKVKSNAEFGKYKISNISGVLNGGFIADSDGNKKLEFAKDENFYIMFPRNQIKEDINVEVTVSAECRAYIILDGQTTVPGTQNYAVTMGEYATAETTAILNENISTGKINITKIDSETKIGIQGVEFELKNEEENVVKNGLTDSDGLLKFENLKPGKYKIIETKTNEDYILSETAQEVEVGYNETEEITFLNEHKKGNVIIKKVDKDNTTLGIGKVEFDLYKIDENINLGTYITDENGEIYIKNLRIGSYKLTEKNTNEYYNKLSDEVDFNVNWEETTEIEVQNEAKKGQVKVIKVDKDNNEIKIEGVEFEVLDKDGNLLGIIKTNEEGEAITSKYAIKDYENIYLKEINTNENYILNSEIIEVKLEENQLKEIKIENEHKKGNLKITKIDKDNRKIVLGNVKFDIYSKEKDKVIGAYTTDENGEIFIENLNIGEYTIIENSTNKWYNLSNDSYITIEWNETAEAFIENELKKGQIKVIKVDNENEEIRLKDVEFNVLDQNGNILETIKTDENGEALTNKYALRDFEKIYLQEIKANKNYILNEEKIEVMIKENIIQEIIIKNEKIKGQIKIIKTSSEDSKVTGDKKGKPLEGVIFEIYNSENELIEKIITDKDGIAITSNLPKGEYKIKEVKGNDWYYIDQKIYNIKIENNNEIVILNITNNPKNPEISIEKIGTERAEVGGKIEYDFSMKNDGNTFLDNFTWKDTVPYEYINVTKFQTGTYNQNIKYNLYYKTNINNEDYILLMEDLNSWENYEIDFEKELLDNEFVTELKLDFGTVDVGFSTNENPHLFANVRSILASETTFENIAKVSGDYNGYSVYDESSFKTFVYKLLPKTGF